MESSAAGENLWHSAIRLLHQIIYLFCKSQPLNNGSNRRVEMLLKQRSAYMLTQQVCVSTSRSWVHANLEAIIGAASRPFKHTSAAFC